MKHILNHLKKKDKEIFMKHYVEEEFEVVIKSKERYRDDTSLYPKRLTYYS